MGDFRKSSGGACDALRSAPIVKAIRSAVVQATGQKDADLEFDLRHCKIAVDGTTEAKLVVPVKGTGRVYTFRVATDRHGRTASVRMEGVHVVADQGWSGEGRAKGGGKGSQEEKSEKIKTWVWVGIAIAVVLAIVITVAVVFAKKAKEKAAEVKAKVSGAAERMVNMVPSTAQQCQQQFARAF